MRRFPLTVELARRGDNLERSYHFPREGRLFFSKQGIDAIGTGYRVGAACGLVEPNLQRAAAALQGSDVAPVNVAWPQVDVVRGSVLVAATGRCPEGMVFIPGGTFMMGSPEGEGDPDEHPQHAVKLSPYCMDKTEVTVSQYRQCMTEVREGVRCTEPGTGERCNWGKQDRDRHPINCVDWEQAATYCRWAGGALPTEAQWEYAARGGRTAGSIRGGTALRTR